MDRYAQHSPQLSMAGIIRTLEKCPKCGDPFKGSPLECPRCLTHPKRYFIDLHHKGRIKLYSDKLGRPLASWESAHRVLTRIRSEIDDHTFDPTRYAKTDLKLYLFENRIREWFKNKKKDAEQGNISDGYVEEIKRFIDNRYLPFFKGMDVREIRTFHIEEFKAEIPYNLSLKYISNILKTLELFFNILIRLELIDRKPIFPKITLHKRAPKWIDADGQMEIIGKIPERDRAIFIFLALQGVRPSESRALKVKDVDLNREQILISRTFSCYKLQERVKGKIIKPRLINPALQGLLTDLCNNKHPESFVFMNQWGRPYSKSHIHRLWADARGDIDITLYEGTRHSVASIAACNGAPITAIKDVLGHSDIKTTMIYAHTDLKSQAVVFKRSADIISFRPSTVRNIKNSKK